MWIQLLLVMFTRVVSTVVYLQENSPEVNNETVAHDGALTCLHILDAEVLTDLCSGTKSSHASSPV